MVPKTTKIQTRPERRRDARRNRLDRIATLALLFAVGVGSIAPSSFRWPKSSRFRVAPLAQPTLESKLASLRPGPEAGYAFAVFGDQRALAGGEWESMIASIDSLSNQDPRLLFMLDTGDIVENGSHSDQFRELAAILAEARSLPYLVGVGNHELDNNRPGTARPNTATFLAPIDPSLKPDRLYYERTIGRVRFLFLDSNDLVYGRGPEIAARREAQLAWLTDALARVPDRPGHPTVVVMHHPLLQSSVKHRKQARDLWSLAYRGRRLPDILADAGVDLILTGHTHTYERIRASRPDGKGFQIVNLSGRPRPAWLWFGEGARRAQMIPEGGERFWFYDRGWRGVENWTFAQEEAMTDDEANQYAVFRVEPDGGVTMAVRFMNRPALGAPVRLLWGDSRSLDLERQK
jgi:hypothetical protein